MYFCTLFNCPAANLPLLSDFLADFTPFSVAMQTHLWAPITLDEVHNAVAGMCPNTAPGPFGIEVGCLMYLLRVDFLAGLITAGLQHLFGLLPAPELLASYLVVIPKLDHPTNVPSNLPPILVTSMWYQLLMRIFVRRLSPELLQVMSPM